MFRTIMSVYIIFIMTFMRAFATGPSTGSGNNTAIGEFHRLCEGYKFALQSELANPYRILSPENHGAAQRVIDLCDQISQNKIQIIPKQGLFHDTNSYVQIQFNSKIFLIDEEFWETNEDESATNQEPDPRINEMIQTVSQYLAQSDSAKKDSKLLTFPDADYKRFISSEMSYFLNAHALTFGEIEGTSARKLYQNLLQLKPQHKGDIQSLRMTDVVCSWVLDRDNYTYDHDFSGHGPQEIKLTGEKASQLCEQILKITEMPGVDFEAWGEANAAELICRYDRKQKSYSCQVIGGIMP